MAVVDGGNEMRPLEQSLAKRRSRRRRQPDAAPPVPPAPVPSAEVGIGVSIVLPVYDERDNLAPLVAEIESALRGEGFEIVAVDDASTDGSLAELQRLASKCRTLRIVELPHHRGQSAALIAGIDRAAGQWVVTMDADGQNDPADLPRLLDMVRRGECDAAVGYRPRRTGGWWKRLQARVGNTARNWITGNRVRDTGCAVRVVRRETMRRLPRWDGMHRFIPTLLRLQGERVFETAVTDRRRRYGKTKYGVRNRLFVGLRDAFAVRKLRRESAAPEEKGPS
jgi:glycosyltransferase involved in cell wall biosynthesis